jgi:DNA replication protein DnaC
MNKDWPNEWWSDIEQPRAKPAQPAGESLDAALERFAKIGEDAKAFRDRVETFAATQPQTITCDRHPHIVRTLDMDKSSQFSRAETERIGDEVLAVQYKRCAECDRDDEMVSTSTWLHRAGVPKILLHASFTTFRIESEEDRVNLQGAKDFVRRGWGLLFMLGNLGDGKSMLSVATMREFVGGKFITQNNLLTELRRGYRDPKAQDVVRVCQNTKCLVIDDFGLSVGGADELPMLQSIFDHRHGEQLPIIVTSNLTLDGVRDCVGARLASRMDQSTFKVLKFSGPSSRAAERTNYFAD